MVLKNPSNQNKYWKYWIPIIKRESLTWTKFMTTEPVFFSNLNSVPERLSRFSTETRSPSKKKPLLCSRPCLSLAEATTACLSRFAAQRNWCHRGAPRLASISKAAEATSEVLSLLVLSLFFLHIFSSPADVQDFSSRATNCPGSHRFWEEKKWPKEHNIQYHGKH